MLMYHISLQRYISPPPINSTDKIIIDVSADIMSILDINEISSIFQVSFQQELNAHIYRSQSFHIIKD